MTLVRAVAALFLLALGATASAAEERLNLYRDFYFGQPREEILAMPDVELLRNDVYAPDTLYRPGAIAGFEADVIFVFSRDSLAAVELWIEGSNPVNVAGIVDALRGQDFRPLLFNNNKRQLLLADYVGRPDASAALARDYETLLVEGATETGLVEAIFVPQPLMAPLLEKRDILSIARALPNDTRFVALTVDWEYDGIAILFQPSPATVQAASRPAAPDRF